MTVLPQRMTQVQDQEFLEYLIKALVDHPEDVKIDRRVDEKGVLLTVQVNAGDMGQVIGKRGATAGAIRAFLKIIGNRNNSNVSVKIEEPEGGRQMRPEASGTPEGGW